MIYIFKPQSETGGPTVALHICYYFGQNCWSVVFLEMERKISLYSRQENNNKMKAIFYWVAGMIGVQFLGFW